MTESETSYTLVQL